MTFWDRVGIVLAACGLVFVGWLALILLLSLPVAGVGVYGG